MIRMRRAERRLASHGGARVAGVAAAGLVVLAGALWSRPASALMPPYVYQSARDNAASVIVITVDKVKPPRRSFGACAVDGTVAKVERGPTYQVGQKVQVEVPCARPNSLPPLGGTIYQDTTTLKASKFGRAYLDDEGKVTLSQYQQLDALP